MGTFQSFPMETQPLSSTVTPNPLAYFHFHRTRPSENHGKERGFPSGYISLSPAACPVTREYRRSGHLLRESGPSIRQNRIYRLLNVISLSQVIQQQQNQKAS